MSELLKINKLILILIAGILFTSSNSMLLVNAQPIRTSLTIDVPSPPTDKECIIKATLKDENGNPLQNMDIGFYECGQSLIGTAKTDSNGVSSLKINTSPGYEIEIKAMFSGTTNYAQSSSEYVYIAVPRLPDYTPFIVGIPIVAIIVGYNIFRRRRNAINLPKMPKEN
jgi:hypothetical protein